MPTTVIIGGGVVGLNIALALSESKDSPHDIFLLECEKFLGHHTSARNSEVLHAGIAYPPTSMKAKLCVEGNRLSRELFDRLGVPYKKTGKWILATNDAEAEGLQRVAENTTASGGVPLVECSPAKAVESVPELSVPRAAMFSPSTAMIDVSGYIRVLDQVLSGRQNVNIVKPCRAMSIDRVRSILTTDRGEMPYDWLVNAAGLFADDVYRMTGGPRTFSVLPYKGEYYRWKNGTVDHVVYPVPGRFVSATGDGALVSSLGIHFHRNIGGDLLLGPSQAKGAADSKLDYAITTPPEKFIEAVTPYLRNPPRVEDLEPAYAGNRPKLYESGKAVGDFQIITEGNIIHLLGIESPGLTAAPAIARHVMEMMH
ncbi:MAG: FAD-dependent oxidoreductase [Deltaproteobacteria bacterium]|nr:FAD-dependent oxidoreductase [Deltaproteobacteria bacterium]